ncbi:phosphoglycerate mutase family protein [Falsochrobactrum sp. TDYN1]|uniref:Phosphoglycerate mutase family protein n=1 Tax=Falsochrobactrum tianjinense TaxID=2706015 RepID=A0A949USX8_9HYPH|nr:histidine phosphatase family protein [Falsochrobactrum sp. TDYN1]MBV2142092.1 phosphoglycerate mutase family protein [Falsochrobactrum sp. TDYN1]
MSKILFISHPEVLIDPHKPVPNWRLSPHGIDRMRAFSEGPELNTIQAIWSSGETKAIEAAGILAGALGIGLSVDRRFNEIDRSATGFLPSSVHEEVADQFFTLPETSIRGWERAVDAQERIVRAFETVMHHHPTGDIAIVGHGGVGTLLLCRLAGLPIDREYDQPFQGHYWSYSREASAIVHRWKPITERL